MNVRLVGDTVASHVLLDVKSITTSVAGWLHSCTLKLPVQAFSRRVNHVVVILLGSITILALSSSINVVV